MELQCPCCGEQFPFEAGFADADGKQLTAQFAGMDPKLGRAVPGYLRLFSPRSRGLRTTKAIRLVADLVQLIDAGQVQRDTRTAEFKPAPPWLWVAGIEQMLAQRERLQLPLENHNYLRAVVWGLASDPAQAQAELPRKARSGGLTPQGIYQDQVGRIRSDMLLGLISKEDGERQIAALKGGV